MLIEVQLFPPFSFPGGAERKSMEVPAGTPVAGLLKVLEESGALAGYSRSSVFALIDHRTVQCEQVLQPGQIVEVLMAPIGG